MHMERYLQYHLPGRKRLVTNSLFERVDYISGEAQPERNSEFDHVVDGLVENGYLRVCL